MDNSVKDALHRGLRELSLSDELATPLWAYAELLLKWNERVNLTAITRPLEVVDKHLLDSVAVLAEVPFGSLGVLDLGAGAGLPGIPWAIARPDLSVTLVDAVQKKVAFVKAAAASLGLAGRVKGVHQRAEGKGDGLGQYDLIVSRAFMDIDRWLPLAAQYVKPGGRVMAMLGQAPDEAVVEGAAKVSGLQRVSTRRFELPLSRDGRGVMVFTPV